MNRALTLLAKLRRARYGHAVAATARALPRLLLGHRIVTLDYPVRPRQRYGWDRPPHERLRRILARGEASYRQELEGILSLRDDLVRIPPTAAPDNPSPRWVNGYLPALDGAALYAVVARRRPSLFLEIGSGNSTKSRARPPASTPPGRRSFRSIPARAWRWTACATR